MKARPLALMRWAAYIVIVGGGLLSLSDLILPREKSLATRAWELAVPFATYGFAMWVVVSAFLIGVFGLEAVVSRVLTWLRDV